MPVPLPVFSARSRRLAQPSAAVCLAQPSQPMLQSMLVRTARVVLPVFIVYTLFTLLTERIGLDWINRALTWPSTLLYVLPGYLTAKHGPFWRAVLAATLVNMVLIVAGLVLILVGVFEPASPETDARLVAYTLVGGVLFAIPGALVGAFAQRRLAAWSRPRSRRRRSRPYSRSHPGSRA